MILSGPPSFPSLKQLSSPLSFLCSELFWQTWDKALSLQVPPFKAAARALNTHCHWFCLPSDESRFYSFHTERIQVIFMSNKVLPGKLAYLMTETDLDLSTEVFWFENTHLHFFCDQLTSEAKWSIIFPALFIVLYYFNFLTCIIYFEALCFISVEPRITSNLWLSSARIVSYSIMPVALMMGLNSGFWVCLANPLQLSHILHLAYIYFLWRESQCLFIYWNTMLTY